METRKIRVSKLDAARRQLDVAIELWFYDRDDVSVHTLAAAVYTIIHDINKKRESSLITLYDSPLVIEEHRTLWNQLLRKPANFFKHADNDPDSIFELDQITTLGFILYCILGLYSLGERHSDYENAFGVWLAVNDPSLLKAEFAKEFSDSVPVEDIAHFKRVPKKDFLSALLQAFANRRARGLT